MKLTDIKSNEDILSFIECCLNDYESGVSSKKETITNVVDLLLYIAKMKSDHPL